MTDFEWYRYLSHHPEVEEINFWRPTPQPFKALKPGGIFCFMLKVPHRRIVGGGFFLHSAQMTVEMAWQLYREGNGAPSREVFYQRLMANRQDAALRLGELITCILLEEPFFVEVQEGIPEPTDFPRNLQFGKGYDLDTSTGRRLFEAIAEILQRRRVSPNSAQSNVVAAANTRGKPRLVLPRIGQQGFRVLVGSAYDYRCAVTGERALPALEAAHILPVAAGGPHLVENGLMLRADLHRLFDAGYLSVDPDERRLLVSRRIREDFHNGREYYQLHGRELRHPVRGYREPALEFLKYHREKVFLE